MNIEEYKLNGQAVYSEFADIVASIIEAAINAAPYQYRIQPIQKRAKSLNSLREKLAAREKLDPERIEETIKDLAGCRLIFYTDDDATHFRDSGILRANFDIDPKRTKPHHPVPGQTDPSNQYRGYHIVVSLKADRVNLPEYDRFKGLFCEVQIQTILNHAWSEMAHDITYKPPKLGGFGEQYLKNIDDQLQKIMNEYLLPAGYEFQKVWNDYQRLRDGKRLVDTEALEELQRIDNNNTRKKLLKRIQKYQLPYYDDLSTIYPDLRIKIVNSVRKARKTKPQSIEQLGYTFDGVTVTKYIKLVADILDQFRYRDIEGTFDSVCTLFLEAENDEERDRLLQSAKSLSAHNLDVWEQEGPYVQQVLLAMIQGFDDAAFEALRPVITIVAKQALETTVSGISSTYTKVTFSTRSVEPSEQLTKVRQDALSIAKKLFTTAVSLQEKIEILDVFSKAGQLPHRGNYSDALVTEVLSNEADIVEFYTEVAPTEEFEVLQAIEHNVLWRYGWCKDEIDKVALDSDALAQCEHLLDSIQKFRNVVDTNEPFTKYKVLVGFQPVFPQSWENNSFWFDGRDEYRTECIETYVEQISAANADDWLSFIRRCAATKTNDGTASRFFDSFLEHIGEHKAEFALSFLEGVEESLAWILVSLLNGLAKSDKKSDTDKKIAEWIEIDKYSPQVARHFRMVSSFDFDLLKKLQDRAIVRNDTETVLLCLASIFSHQNKVTKEIEDGIIHPSFQYLTEHKNTDWIQFSEHLLRDESLLASASQKTVDLALNNLIHVRCIDHDSEYILGIIADKTPEKVIDFFAERILHEENMDTSDWYEAVPFKLDDLKDKLSEADGYLLEVTRKLFTSDDFLRQSFSTQLFTAIFPSFSENVEAKLNDFIQSGSYNDLEFIANVLNTYQGDNFFYDVCKNLIDALVPDDKLLSTIHSSLMGTGVVSGEFGVVEAYKQKKADIEHWRSDDRARVQDFAEAFLSSLDNYITSEQKRAEERLEMGKLEWGADEEDDELDENSSDE